MNDSQPTREEADSALAKAIVDHAVAYDIANTETHMLGDFGFVVHWMPVVDDKRSCYTTAFHQDHVPNHIAVGLFTTGLDILEDTSYEEQ